MKKIALLIITITLSGCSYTKIGDYKRLSLGQDLKFKTLNVPVHCDICHKVYVLKVEAYDANQTKGLKETAKGAVQGLKGTP